MGVRAIAFYLPQFHPIPENDAWWGKGFTEWRNVVRARPLFPGHNQPQLPADLGFYDLRLTEAREAQAQLAQEYGLSGFCYYHYWFSGKRLLERPFTEVLASGTPRLPFCLCWANENWTRGWDGQDEEILVRQEYSRDDDVAHIRSLLPAFRDKRYIRVNDKPVFLVYRVSSLPDAAVTAGTWREEMAASGFPGIYLVMVTSLPELHFDPGSIGFDAALDFQPDWRGPLLHADTIGQKLGRLFEMELRGPQHYLRDYARHVYWRMTQPEPSYKLLPCVMPGWDNSPRRKDRANIFQRSTPEVYGRWLRHAAETASRRFAGDERLVFINAWNEWAEGTHLEPDLKWGRRYLEETRASLAGAAYE